LSGWHVGSPDAVRIFRRSHPRFPDDRVPWLPKPMSAEEGLAPEAAHVLAHCDRHGARLEWLADETPS
jgi:hypothetical protein